MREVLYTTTPPYPSPSGVYPPGDFGSERFVSYIYFGITSNYFRLQLPQTQLD